MKAHQDHNVALDTLNQKLQLNCICDHLAKQRISNLVQLQQQENSLFPLEPIGIFIKGTKLLPDTGQQIRFHTHHHLAMALFLWKKILSGKGFDKVGWDSVHATLHLVLRLFQVGIKTHAGDCWHHEVPLAPG